MERDIEVGVTPIFLFDFSRKRVHGGGGGGSSSPTSSSPPQAMLPLVVASTPGGGGGGGGGGGCGSPGGGPPVGAGGARWGEAIGLLFELVEDPTLCQAVHDDWAMAALGCLRSDVLNLQVRTRSTH